MDEEDTQRMLRETELRYLVVDAVGTAMAETGYNPTEKELEFLIALLIKVLP